MARGIELMASRVALMRILLLAALVSVAAPVTAQVSLGLEGGLSSRRNITRAVLPEDQVDDDVAYLGAEIAHTSSTVHIATDLSYGFTREKYLNNSFSDSDLISGSGSILLRDARGTMSWVLENNTDESTINVLDPDVPENRDRISSTSTGPTLNFWLSQRESVGVTVLRTWVRTSLGFSGSDSLKYSLQWNRTISSKLDMVLAVSRKETEPLYSDPLTQDRANLTLTRRLRLGGVNLMVGHVRLDDKDGEKIGDSPEYQLSLDWTADRQTLTAEYSRIVSESGAEDRVGRGGPVLPGSPVFELNLIDTKALGYEFALVPNRLLFNLDGTREQRQGALADSRINVETLGTGLSWQLRKSVVQFKVELENRESETDFESGSTEQTNYYLSYERPIGQSMNVSLSYERQVFDTGLDDSNPVSEFIEARFTYDVY